MTDWIPTDCNRAACIQIGVTGEDGNRAIAIRDTKTGGQLWFSRDEWAAHVAAVKAGTYDESCQETL